jgi:hypothetical protein
MVGVVYESALELAMSVHDPPGTRTCHFFVRVAPEIVPKFDAVNVAVAPRTPVALDGLEVIEMAGMYLM